MFALTQSADQSGIRTSGVIMNIVAPRGSGGGLGGMLGGQSGGAMLGSMAGMVGQFLPPQARPLLAAGGFVMNGGLSSLMSGNVGGLMGLGGIASQFMPPYAGDALMAGQMLMSGASPMQMMQGLMGRFLPPELQGVLATMQKMGGPDKLLSSCFPKSGQPSLSNTPEEEPLPESMQPWAARVGDMVLCPAGMLGPILKPAARTVIIGGLVAARVGDKAVCKGPPDEIEMGETTVQIAGKDAARKGDPTKHCGMVISGWPTVWIGKSLAGTARCIQVAAEGNVPLVVGPTIE